MLLMISYMVSMLLTAFYCYETLAADVGFTGVGVCGSLWIILNILMMIILIVISTSMTTEVNIFD